ncbi:hypothetical protein CJP72_05905 [Citrobacter sp. NCU1]|uniref:glycosyltransferase n=1 Tax=Citrobacter sp. NCU1 TaxID=2026683 RepID=UPI001390E3ED|nr:glycosyltransferase [Citrobacter sp. NCU1]NDO80325.1 hypothetical protein [Citrobacter sp. NCU1]
MKKIAIIFPFARENGACRVPCEHSQMFVNAGYQVDLIVRDSDSVFPFAGNLINLNIKSRKGILKAVTYIELLYKVNKIKKQNNYDISISHIPHCDLINVLTKRKEKTITTVHINNERRYSFISNGLLGFILSRSDHVVAVSSKLKLNLSLKYGKYKNKIVNIYNPVNIRKIKQLSELPIDDNLPSPGFIINIGRLDVQKGQCYLIKAFATLLHNYPRFDNLKLIIIGDGPLKEQLTNLIKEIGVEDKVLLVGFKENPYNYLKNAKMFVLTSLYEGFPLVLLEAMACGTPIISAACETGPYELLHESDDSLSCGVLTPDFAVAESGKAFEVDDLVNNLSDKMAELLNSPVSSSQLVLNATAKVQRFAPEEIMKYWENLFGDNNGK